MKTPKKLEEVNAAWILKRKTTAQGHLVLIVDDSEADIYFLLRAIQQSKVKNPVHLVRSGEEALQYLAGKFPYDNREDHPLPSVIFLDLKMPPPNGLDILRWKQRHPELGDVLFVAMSNFDSISSINQAYASGATTFLSKPVNPEDIKNIIQCFDQYWDRSRRKAKLLASQGS